MISEEQLAARLKEAREASGMTQEEVAKELGISRPAVSQLEQGKRAVSSMEFERMAYLFGRRMGDFFAEEFRGEDAVVALFRGRPDLVDRKKLLDLVRDCIRLGQELSNLEKRLQISRVEITPQYAPATPNSMPTAVDQGEWFAAEERRRLGLGMGPVHSIAELLESEGVRTAWVEMPKEVSGLTLRPPGEAPLVVINRAHGGPRRRFSLAHEYAHVLLDADRVGMVTVRSDQADLREVRANAFAATFLMPEVGVVEFLASLGRERRSRRAEVFDGEGEISVRGRSTVRNQRIQLPEVVLLAHHFGVSREAALYRLRNLGWITRPQLQELQDQEGAEGREYARLLGLREVHPELERYEFAHRFVGLALEALRREAISRRKFLVLVTMVGHTKEEAQALLELSGLDDKVLDVLIPESLL